MTPDPETPPDTVHKTCKPVSKEEFDRAVDGLAAWMAEQWLTESKPTREETPDETD